MKKSRLTAGYDYDFELIGIVSPAKEYKLAWHLNQLHCFHLIKTEDIRMEFSDHQVKRISVLQDESEFRQVYLLKNRLVAAGAGNEGYFITELDRFDYLLKISSEVDENWSNQLILNLKDVSVIDYAVQIDVLKLKMKDNLLF